MWAALNAHHDIPQQAGCRVTRFSLAGTTQDALPPLSSEGMTMDAKELFARQETASREIRQQLEREHAVLPKTAPKPTAQKVTVRDPVWGLRPRPMGTHRTKT